MGTSVLVVSQAIYLGCVYALIAIGLTITYSATRVINFAQGEYFVLGAAGAYELYAVHKLPLWLVVIAVILAAAVLGVLTERAIMIPVNRSGVHYAWIIATLAVAIILETLFGNAFPSTVLQPAAFVPGSVTLFGATVSSQIFLLAGVSVAVMAGYELFLARSIHGRAIRATAQDPETASTFGIGVRSVVLTSFVISAVITALAGWLVSPVLFIQPTDGLTYTINGFVAMVIGGVGSSRGAILGGLIVGVLNAVVVNLVNANLGEVITVGALA
ncbi:MAG: branched-chain amino acid ABC transporter permease, partial [Trebonia sp.]